MTRILVTLLASVAVLAVTTLPARAAEEGKETKKEEKIALDKLPEVVKAAAEKAVKGIVLTKAEKVTKGDKVTYEIDGTADGKLYEIKVAADGTVIKTKEEKPEEADDKEDDKDDDD